MPLSPGQWSLSNTVDNGYWLSQCQLLGIQWQLTGININGRWMGIHIVETMKIHSESMIIDWKTLTIHRESITIDSVLMTTDWMSMTMDWKSLAAERKSMSIDVISVNEQLVHIRDRRHLVNCQWYQINGHCQMLFRIYQLPLIRPQSILTWCKCQLIRCQHLWFWINGHGLSINDH